MNRSTGIVIGVLVAFASSVAATGSTPPGLPWVTARKPAKILITNGAFSDVGLGVYSNDDDAASLFQPAAEIASTCTASDGESFNPNTTINITGSHTVDGPTVGNAAIVASRVQSVNRILSADGAAGTPTITATAPVCEIKSDVTRTGTGLVSNSAPVLEVIENDTLGTGSALKITQKATAGDALQVWDVDSLNASIDDQGNVSCRDVTSTNEVRGAVLSTLTAVDLYDPAPSANRISIQAPSGISSWLMILPPNDGNSGDVLTTDGTGTTTWTAPVVGDITSVGSMTSGAAFADATADNAWLGLGSGAGRVEFDDLAVDEINILDANVGIGTSTPTSLVDVVKGSLVSAHAIHVTATSDGSFAAIRTDVSTSGSDTQPRLSMQSLLTSGFTGNAATVAVDAENVVAGTGNDFKFGTSFSNPTGNSGINGFAGATTTGLNVGSYAEAVGGSTNAGAVGKSITAKNSANNIGVIGVARNTGTSPVEIGGFFGLYNSTPTWESAALIADNGGTTNPIFLARDNGTTTFTIADGGNITTSADLAVNGGDITSTQDQITVNKPFVLQKVEGDPPAPVAGCVAAREGSMIYVQDTNPATNAGGICVCIDTGSAVYAWTAGTPAPTGGCP